MRKIFISLLLGLSLGALLVPATAYAFDPFGDVCNDSTSQSALCQGKGDGTNPLTGTKGLIRTIANVLAIVTGLGAVITIIVAGFRFITSGGEPAATKSAREAIIAAIIGVAIVSLADLIISFVISKV